MMGMISVTKLKAIAFVLGGGAFLMVSLQVVLSSTLPIQPTSSSQKAEVISAMQEVNPFENLITQARAVYVLEVKTGAVLFARNENEKLPLASITKVMTALLAREHMSESVVLTLVKNDLSADGDSGLHTGERWRVGDLLNLMLLVSSNDAAHAVSTFVGKKQQNNVGETPNTYFIKMMNEKAQALGLVNTEFFNESGLDLASGLNGGYGSARDVGILFLELWSRYPETVDVTAKKDARILSQDNIVHTLSNTNEIVGRIPGMIASKTGYTSLAGGNLAVIFDRGIGDPVLIVVLGSSYKGRFDDVSKLAETARLSR